MKILLVLMLVCGIYSSLLGDNAVEYDYEVDIYYSNVSAFIDLDRDANITDATSFSETQIYTTLFKNSFNPNIFLLEASVHPMGLGGIYFRKSHEDIYDRSKIQNFNWIKALTAGFEEPYSLSFFVGRMMVFKNQKNDRIGKNRAYLGTLVSVGDLTIKDNLVHYDKWVNIEYKLKGTRNNKDKDLDWSFRVGTRIHQNNNFTNNIYIGARRSSIDYKKSVHSFIYNSAFSTMIALNTDSFNLNEAEFMLEKKWPLSWGKKLSFGLGIGYLYNSGEKYRGKLREEGTDNHQVMLRPNFKW